MTKDKCEEEKMKQSKKVRVILKIRIQKVC
jgi:hypothetical protein